jgi:MscS family membrane protein
MKSFPFIISLLFIHFILTSSPDVTPLQDSLNTLVNEPFELPDDEIDASSPYSALLKHLGNLTEENYNPEEASKVFLYPGVDSARGSDLAIKLFQYYNAKGYLIRLDEVSRDPNYKEGDDSVHRYQVIPLHPEIYLNKVGDEWLYSKKTINQIDRLHKEAFPFGTDRLLKMLPRIGQEKYLGLHLWQLVGLLGLIFISFVLHSLLTYFFKELFYKLIGYWGYKEVGKKFLGPVASPFSWFILVSFSLVFVRVLQLPISIGIVLITILEIFQPFFGAFMFYRMVDVLSSYLERIAEKTESTLDDQLVPLIRKTLKAFVIIIGILVILREGLKVDIWPILTGLSIGGIAIALAAQDTLKNFFGSIMIFIDRPFQIGQWITTGEIDGVIEEVGFRSTRVRTFRDSVMYVPNAKLADSIIDNHSLRRFRRLKTDIAITYDTPAHVIQVFVEGLKEIHMHHPLTKKDAYFCNFYEMGSSSLNVLFTVFLEVDDRPAELQAIQEILLEVIKLTEKLGIRFAFPTQTLFVEEIPGQPSLTPLFSESPAEIKAKLESYLSDKHPRSN